MKQNPLFIPRRLAGKPSCETLEGRTLLSGLGGHLTVPAALLGRLSHHAGGIKTDPAGVAAITSALNGGPGSEFVSLFGQGPSISSVAGRFARGKAASFHTSGVAIATPGFQSQFTGRHYDHLALTAAGAVVLPGHKLELGAVLRGPEDEPVPAYYVFGLDRGAGTSLGPAFPERPGITPDALVTITVAPYSTAASGTITDLKTGSVTGIDASRIQVNGATVRVFLDAAQVPSTGRPIAQYRFAAWTRSQLTGGIEQVGSFLPDSAMIPVGTSGGGRAHG